MTSSILDSLDRLPGRLEAQALDNLREALEFLLAETKLAIEGPHFADLRASLRIEIDPAGLSGRVISTAPYADEVDARHPFLAATYQRVRPEIEAILSRPPATE